MNYCIHIINIYKYTSNICEIYFTIQTITLFVHLHRLQSLSDADHYRFIC